MKRSKSSFNDFSRKHASCEPYYPIRDTENFYKSSVCFCCIISHLEKSLVMFYRNYFSVFYEDIIISLNILPPFEEDLDLPSQITILNPFCTVNNIVLAKYSQAHFLYFIHTRGNGQGPKSEKTWFPFIQGNIWQFFVKIEFVCSIRLLTIRATNILYTVHEILKTINMYGAVYVVCVIVLIIQTAECSCPCETEQQCKIIKDDNRKEVIMQSFYCGF